MPNKTPAANRIKPAMKIPITINNTGTIFSNKNESFGICDLPVLRFGFDTGCARKRIQIFLSHNAAASLVICA